MRIVASVAAMELLACGAQRAETHIVAGTLPMQSMPTLGEAHWDCDTPAENFNSWPRDVSAASGHVSGTAYFRAIRVPAEYFPAASVSLRGARGESAGLSFVRYPQPSDSTALQIVYGQRGSAWQRTWFKHHRDPLGAPLRFELRWTADHLEVRLPPDEEWTTVPMAFTPVRFVAGCTSSEVIFHDINIESPVAPTAIAP